jgi:hypothetical protein
LTGPMLKNSSSPDGSGAAAEHSLGTYVFGFENTCVLPGTKHKYWRSLGRHLVPERPIGERLRTKARTSGSEQPHVRANFATINKTPERPPGTLRNHSVARRSARSDQV